MRQSCMFAAAAVFVLSGCATSLEKQNLRESPSFQVGYGDGCATANEDDKSFSRRQNRDAYSFENDDAYRTGWRQGYLECGDRIPEAKDGGRILGERGEY